MNTQYEKILKSIGVLPGVVNAIHADTETLSAFTKELLAKEQEISKFETVSAEIGKYLDNYNFAGGYKFQDILKSLESLYSFRQKLQKMSDEAKKFEKMPDRYGSKDVMKTCNELALVCMKRMSLSEIIKVEYVVETNTRKLQSLQKLFERDNQILSQINALVQANLTVLQGFKAYSAELKKYISEFPHPGVDDLSIVRERIVKAAQVLELSGKVKGNVDKLSKCPDRYNRNDILRNYMQISQDMSSKMLSAEVPSYQTKLNDIQKKIDQLLAAFERDKQMLSHINALIQAEMSVLQKFKAYLAELGRYISEFPHPGVDDLSVVNERIAKAKHMLKIWHSVENVIARAKDLPDRYGKKDIFDKYSQICGAMSSRMLYADLGSYENQLEEILRRVRMLHEAFAKEEMDGFQFRQLLIQKRPEVWREDNEHILAKLNSLLTGTPAGVSLDLSQLKAEYICAKDKRTRDIEAMLNKYKWLEGGVFSYKKSHEELLSKFQKYAAYQSSVEELRRRRRTKLLCIPVIGWIILLFDL